MGGEEEEFEFRARAEKEQAEPPQSAIPKAIDTDPAVGMGEAALALGSGMAGSIAGGISGLVGAATPGPAGQGADRVQSIIDALRYNPRTQAGQKITNAASLPFEAIANLANKAAGPVADAGHPLTATAIDTGIQALPMLAGKVVPKVAGVIAPKPNPKPAFAGQAGLSVLPEEAKAGVLTKTAASIADEPKLAKDISRKNNPILADKIASDFNLPKGTELDLPTIRTVRKDASAPFEKVRKLGDIETDAKFAAEADAIADQYRSASRSFPKMAKADVEKIVEGIKVDKFNANDAVDMMKTLREDASDAFSKGDKRMGFASKRASDAIEGMIERHVQKISAGSDMAGDPATAHLVSDLRKARATIAQTFVAEKALGPNGTINPQVYFRELKKDAPLTGGARQVAEFARDFPRSSLKPSTTPTQMNAMDVLSGMLTKEGMLPFVRPAMRSALASGPVQSMLVRNPGALSQALGSPAAEGALPAIGAGGTAGQRSLAEMIQEATGGFPPRRGAPSGRVGGGTR